MDCRCVEHEYDPDLQNPKNWVPLRICPYNSSGTSKAMLNPYLFTHPNPTNAIISWTFSWQTITIFLSFMV